MKSSAFFSLVLILAITGCTTKRDARLKAEEAYLAGQKQAIAQMQQPKTVSFIGDVQNRVITWTEDLTMANAIVAADYRGRHDPKAFVLHRNGQNYPISARQLLQGEDFSLQPGDTIEIVP